MCSVYFCEVVSITRKYPVLPNSLTRFHKRTQALQLVRGLRGLNIVGCDVVEVCPPYDSSGNTALVAANIAFELLCVLPGVKYAPK